DVAHHDVVAQHMYMQDRMRDSDDRQFSQHYEELDVPPDLLQSCIPLNDDIELAEVEVSVKHLLTGKAVGPDAIPSEALKHGGDAMLAALHQLCRLVWRQGEVPMDWLRGVIVPLYKDGDKLLPANHRPITLLSIVGKVYSGILHARLLAWSERHNIIVPEQGGFRPGRGCAEHLFTLTELIKMRRLQGKRTYACFIDIKKAYDTVWHDGMKIKLLQYGIHGRMYAAICSLYAACESSIKLGGELGYTSFFPVDTGVRQGCILSPWLYSLFINDLARALNEQRQHGVKIGDRYLCQLLYADDIALLSEREIDLQHLMTTVHEYAHRWRFEVNHAKCGLMRFNVRGKAVQLPSSVLNLGGTPLSWVASYKYLGVELHNGIPFKQYRKRMHLKTVRVSNAVAAMGMYSGKLPVPIAVQVYKALVRPLLEYAAEVHSIQSWSMADQLQVAMCKRILQCTSRTASVFVTGELGLPSMEARYQQLRVTFYGKLICSEEQVPSAYVFHATMTHHAASDSGDAVAVPVAATDGWDIVRPPPSAHGLTLWCAQIQHDLYQLGLCDYWNQPSKVS